MREREREEGGGRREQETESGRKEKF